MTRANQQKDKDKDARSRETRASLSNYVIFCKMAIIFGMMILMVKMVGVSLSTVSIKYSLRMCRVFLVKYNQSHTIHQRHTLIPYTTSSQNNMCLFF